MLPWRLGVGLLLAAAYALASHWIMVHAAGQAWSVAVLIGPLLLVALVVALRRRHLPSVAAALFGGIGLAAIVVHGGVGDINRLYVLQHAGFHFVLGVSFALTLRRGKMSLITLVAQRVHRTLTPDMVSYTHHVTAAWALYFFAMAIVSLWVYATCAWDTWSLLANVVTPLAILALFVGEYLLRYRLHPEFEHATLMDALRAYRGSRS